MQLPSSDDNPSPYEGDARTKYFPLLRGGRPFPIPIHKMSDGGERDGKFSTTYPNSLPGAVKWNRIAKSNPFTPDSPFKPTLTDVTRWIAKDRPNKTPNNAVSAISGEYRAVKSEWHRHYDQLCLSEFSSISR